MMFEQVWRELVARWMPGDPFQPSDQIRKYYETKWDIVRRIRHAHVLEIGVRAGYSAFVFTYDVPGAVYLGIDNALADMEGRRDYLAHARDVVLKGIDARLWIVDSSTLLTFPHAPDGASWDLVHVDGHHSFRGCYHDLECSALVGARRILVDDYDTGPAIREACTKFVASGVGGKWRAAHYPDGGVAGNMLLTRTEKDVP